jgi:hypothetical protein
MSHLIYGETLVWVTYDPAKVFSAGLKSMLDSLLDQDCRVEVSLATSLDQTAAVAEQTRCGLLTLVLGPNDELPAMRVLRRVQTRLPECVRCVYFPELLQLDRMRLQEAGAQIVIEQIPLLQVALPQLLAKAPRRTGGNHPLTAGLIDRLPW